MILKMCFSLVLHFKGKLNRGETKSCGRKQSFVAQPVFYVNKILDRMRTLRRLDGFRLPKDNTYIETSV